MGGEASEEVSIHIDLSTVLSFPLMSLTRLGTLMNIFRSLLPFLLVILIILAVSPSDSAATILDGTVVSVSDGDTITVLDSDKVQHRVRIAGNRRTREGPGIRQRIEEANERVGSAGGSPRRVQ